MIMNTESLFTKVTFKIEVPFGYIKNHEVVAIVGDTQEVGNWSIKGSIELSMSESNSQHQIWTVTLSLPSPSKIQYKYIVVNKIRSSSPILIEWEAAKGQSRALHVEGIEMFTNDGKFGIIGSQTKPWIGRGWLPVDEYQLRIQLQVDENPLKLYNSLYYDETDFVIRLHDPLGLSQDFTLPINSYQELVLHANSLDHLKFTVSILLLDDLENKERRENERKKEKLLKDQEQPTQKSSFKNLIKRKLNLSGSKNKDNDNNDEIGDIVENENDQQQDEDNNNNTTTNTLVSSTLVLPLKNTPIKDCYSVIGKCFITPTHIKKKWGKINAPIINNHDVVIGEFRCNYLVVTPFAHPQNSLSTLWHTFVEHPQSLIGHRGNGKNNFGVNTSAITENTVLSFLTAARFGAKMIEFDLQLTYDNHPVIFHDYEIEIETVEGVLIKESINRLTLDQFLKLKPNPSERHQKENNPLSNAVRKLKKLRLSKSTGDLNNLAFSEIHPQQLQTLPEVNGASTSNINNNNNNNNTPSPSQDTQPNFIHDRYSTLQDSFQLIPQDIGFLIEIKYPNLEMQNLRRFTTPERNEFIDIILNIVFSEAKDRRIAFLTFDPDIAIILRTKQFRYPVLFLICSDTPNFLSVFDPDVNVYDIRGNSTINAISFAKAVNLDGIVCDSETILANHSLVNLVHQDNLLLFTYGSKNVDPINVKTQNDLGVDGIIADNMTKLSKKLRDLSTSIYIK